MTRQSATTRVAPIPEGETMRYTHTLSGRTFTADAPGSFGAASVDGHWDSGEAGTIWPAEQFRDGAQVWVSA